MRRPKLLIVDDEIPFSEGLSNLLSRRGYEVSAVNNGDSALRILREDGFDVILLDICMPGMDGREVLTQIKALDPDAEVIIMTGHGDMEMAIECLHREASCFLTKPVEFELLSRYLTRSLERASLKKKNKQYRANIEALLREANVELERAYRFRDTVIENSPDAIVCARNDGLIIIANSGSEKLLGYTKKEAVGKMNISDIFPSGEAERMIKDLRSEDLGGAGNIQKREFTVFGKQGNEIPVHLSASILYQQGKEAGFLLVFTDFKP